MAFGLRVQVLRRSIALHTIELPMVRVIVKVEKTHFIIFGLLPIAKRRIGRAAKNGFLMIAFDSLIKQGRLFSCYINFNLLKCGELLRQIPKPIRNVMTQRNLRRLSD